MSNRNMSLIIEGLHESKSIGEIRKECRPNKISPIGIFKGKIIDIGKEWFEVNCPEIPKSLEGYSTTVSFETKNIKDIISYYNLKKGDMVIFTVYDNLSVQGSKYVEFGDVIR